MEKASFGQKVLHKISLSKYSLQKQVIIIFSTLLLLVIVLLMPLIARNLDNVVDTEMFDMLQNSQGIYSNYDIGDYLTKEPEKTIYHLKFMITEDQNHENQYHLVKMTALTDEEAYNWLKNVFGDDLKEMINDGEEVVEAKTEYQGDVLYYRIMQGKDNSEYIISLAKEDYYHSLVGNFKQQVVYVIYTAIVVIAAILYIWVLTLIAPLKLIRTYINDIKEDKNTTLKIDRNDEIGVVSKSLIAMKEDLDIQNKIKEEMIHNISHDLKTPIALIKTYAQSIKDDIYPYGDKASSTDVIIENAERLEKKVYSLLYLNRLDYLRDHRPEHDVNMKELIEHITVQMVAMHPEIVVDLHLEDVTFRGNEEYWRTCIENIIENAYRYVNNKIEITLRDNYLEIYNDGEKMDEDNIESLFKPYEKGIKGQFGLGLSIVQKTVSLYHYAVKAVNKDVGVSFIIYKK
jgi:two-component system sensor histidine kinase CssS